MIDLTIEKLEGLPAGLRPIEVVERKGIGHPDTICDLLSERLSVALSRHYLGRFGQILHHNVDKALLAAGRAEAAFGGGEVLEPIDIYLSGRAMTDVAGEHVPVEQLVDRVGREFFRNSFHALDADRHVRLHCLLRPGAAQLVELVQRPREQDPALCNDTSCGVGFAPLTVLERVVLGAERRLNAPATKSELPACGEDVKIMGVRRGESIALTIACAMIGRFLSGLDDYADAKRRVAALVGEAARAVTGSPVEVAVNAADDPGRGAVYLTVTGTSAESADDGETGRGNRMNGLITPMRPMTLEAAAGKNPVAHVGKLYGAVAQQIAAGIVGDLTEVRNAECYMVSRIGAPIDQPRAVVVRLDAVGGSIGPSLERRVNEIVASRLAGVTRLWRQFLTEEISVC